MMTLSVYSSVRKLKRAIERGEVPPERQNKIDMALVNAHKRAEKYMHRVARERWRARTS